MIDDAERSGFNITKPRTARTEKRCKECLRSICKGEQYFYDSGVWEGKWFHYSTCQHCAVAKEWLLQECGGFVYGGVGADIAEHIDGMRWRTPLSLARLLIGMRRQWKRIKEDTLLPVPTMPPVTSLLKAA